MTAVLEFHPLANLFPLLEGAEFDALVDDVRAHGVREPIWLYEGKILDGRNRWRAAQGADAYCPLREYLGDGPVAFVISLNLKRRHLDESQRAMVAAKLANMPAHRPDDKSANLQTSQEAAAKLLNVSTRTVASAKQVHDKAVPELKAAVEAGNVSVSAAADVANLPIAEQQEIVARGEKEILEAAKAIRAEKVAHKRAGIIAEHDKLRERNATLPQSERKYGAILADPPWPFEAWSEAGKRFSVENHYPTMPLAEIEALHIDFDDGSSKPVGELAAENCVLFLWTTWPQLFAAKQVMEAWGFEYKTVAFNWLKPIGDDEEHFVTGNGYWTRSNSEVCLLGIKGKPVRLNADVHQVILAPRRGHSVKPDEAAERIERLVSGPYLELFARRGREGWDYWGLEAPDDPRKADPRQVEIEELIAETERPPAVEHLDIPEFLRRQST
jgi:N6-adenosine-specific RNA methylase IME4